MIVAIELAFRLGLAIATTAPSSTASSTSMLGSLYDTCEVDFIVHVAIAKEIVFTGLHTLRQVEVVVLSLLKVKGEKEDGIAIPGREEKRRGRGSDEGLILSSQRFAELILRFESLCCFATIGESGSESMDEMLGSTRSGGSQFIIEEELKGVGGREACWCCCCSYCCCCCWCCCGHPLHTMCRGYLRASRRETSNEFIDASRIDTQNGLSADRGGRGRRRRECRCCGGRGRRRSSTGSRRGCC